MGKDDFERVAGATVLVEPSADETTEKGSCSFDNVVAGGVAETKLPSLDNMGLRFSAETRKLATVAGVEFSTMRGGAGL